MGMMIKQNKSAIENAKREELLKAAQVIKNHCANKKPNCNGCLFHNRGCVLNREDCPPEDWKIPSASPTREEMRSYVNVYGRNFHFARNGRTTAVLWCGDLYAVTRYYKDAEDELVAKYELLKKIFG